MFDLLAAGGWVMPVIVLCSVIALGICIERSVALHPDRIAPPHLLANVWKQLKAGELDAQRLKALRHGSPLGAILAAGLANRSQGRDVMKESIQEAAGHVVHDLERYLNTLGTVAAVAPLLGLLGTVVGMIRVFTEITVQGTGNANALAGGISEALITTAAGWLWRFLRWSCTDTSPARLTPLWWVWSRFQLSSSTPCTPARKRNTTFEISPKAH